MYQDAEVLSRLEIVLRKSEVSVYSSALLCNLEMEGSAWRREYIKLIPLRIPIRIASSQATEILDNTLLKRFLRENGKRFCFPMLTQNK